MKYIALKDMPFWAKGEVKEENAKGVIHTVHIIALPRTIKAMIQDGWIAEYNPRTYTIEEIEKVWNKITSFIWLDCF